MIIKNRLFLIAIIAVVAIILGCVYAFVLVPMLHDTTDEPPTLLEGEVLGPNNQIIMFEQIVRADLQEIECHNEKGGFTFYYDEEIDDFLLKDYYKSPYSKENFGILVTSAGYSLTQTRVTEHCEDFSEYGLADSDNPAYYIIRSKSGVEHKVYIGKMLVQGNCYYARYDGRDAVYVIDTDSASYLLAGVADYITPMLILPVSQSDYFTVKDFMIAKDGKPFVQLTSKIKESVDKNGNKTQELENYEMVYPIGYNVSTKYDTVLQSFQTLQATKTLEVGKSYNDEEKTSVDIPDEVLEKYNLKTPKYEVFFEYKGVKNSFVISEKNENGTYYVYSLLYNHICEIDEESVGFLEWDLIEFVEKSLFQYNLTDVSIIKLKTKDFEETFLLYNLDTGKETAAGTVIDIEVKRKSNGENISDVTNFRNYFYILLTTQFIAEADVTSTEGLENYATVEIITRQGKKIEYGFYPYATRRCLLTIDGKGEFYVLKSSVDKLISDAKKVINGETVNRESAE